MGIAVAVFWIVAGLLYVIYKFCEEKLNLSRTSSVGCTVGIAVAFFLLGGLAKLSIDIFGEDIAGVLFPTIFAAGIICISIRSYRAGSKRSQQTRMEMEELSELVRISKALPTPTCAQMTAFIYDIRHAKDPSRQQQTYRQMLEDADSNKLVPPLDATHFKDMQAAWILCTNDDTKLLLREREFGNQDLSTMPYFDPTIDRAGEPVTGCDTKAFWNLVKQIPVEFKQDWCRQPMFARKVFRMIEDSVPVTAEILYPIMLESYEHPALIESTISADHMKQDMSSDLAQLWDFLAPKRAYVLAAISMRQDERNEWEKVKEFRLEILRAIQNKRAMTNSELFPVILEIYNKLLEEDSIKHSQKYKFATLWYGLNNVGKAIGKEGLLFDYPKYSVDSKGSGE